MEGACLEVLHRQRRVVHDLDRAQRGPARLGERAAGVREPDPPPVALEELQAHGLLEVAQLLGDRRLGQEKGGGCAGDVLGLGDGDEGPNLLQGEGRLAHRDILVGLMQLITNY